MQRILRQRVDTMASLWLSGMVVLLALLLCPAVGQAQEVNLDSIALARQNAAAAADSLAASRGSRPTAHARSRAQRSDTVGDTAYVTAHDSLALLPDTLTPAGLGRLRVFNPDPMRAMWLSALFPGLGQIYNHRYWKLPIIVGAFVGLGYATSWNNRMLRDYTKGYRDLMDNDPNTRSYMDFFAPTVKESDLDVDWLKRSLKNKKDYYRRYRDICVFGLIGVYALQVIDAYVDASLSHFDISPDLSMDVAPAVMQHQGHASLGLQCAFNF